MVKIGHGYDVHKFDINRKLILGGVEIDYEFGLLGHSDADVLTHSICDALLGAACLGDIGKHFPDSDNKYKNANSIDLLKEVVDKINHLGYSINNIDCTVIAQKPKLRVYIDKMREIISNTCKIDIEQINIKATTEEGLGFTGRLEGISSHAVCIIKK